MTVETGVTVPNGGAHEVPSAQTDTIGEIDIAQTTLQQNATQEPKADWYLSEGIAAQGEKPDWFADKTFKTVEDQAKAYKSLQKKMSEKGGAAPDDGKYSLNLGDAYKDVTFNDDDALMNGWKNVARDNKFSNEQFNAGIKMWLGYLDNFKEQNKASQLEAIKGLGVGGEQTISEIENWFDNSYGDIVKFDEFKQKLTSASDLQLLRKMKDASVGSNVIKINESVPEKSRDYFLKAMNKNSGFGIDQVYTDKIRQELLEYSNNKK